MLHLCSKFALIDRDRFYYRKMQISFDSVKESQGLIKRLLLSIEEATESMNQSFEGTMVRHEEEFMKCYKIKIYELIKLFEQLKSTIEDKFINNTLALQLETVLKERDYFKYQCLKLNAQHQTLLDDHRNLTAQANNSTQQITIYKHLLQNEKIRTSEIETNLDRLKKNLTDIATRALPEPRHLEMKPHEVDREVARLRREGREKSEAIRALRERVQELQRAAAAEHEERVEKKELYQLFRACVEGWKRQLKTKSRKDLRSLSVEQLSQMNKKELLRTLFTHSEFLRFLERLLFDDGFKVTFESVEESYFEHNRGKLLQFMNKRKIYTSARGLRL